MGDSFIKSIGRIFKGDAGTSTGGYFKADANNKKFEEELRVAAAISNTEIPRGNVSQLQGLLNGTETT